MFNLHNHASKPEIFITENDRQVLKRLASATLAVPDIADELLNELDRAKSMPATEIGKFISIGTKATFAMSSGEEKTVELVMPADADISAGRISILTPVGVALLGLSVGQSINWTTKDGRAGRLTVLKIHGTNRNN